MAMSDMDFSGSRPRDRSASVSPLEGLQNPVDKPSPSVEGHVLLTQYRGPYVPPAVVPNSEWSRYTDSGTARTALDANPIHSQGPSYFAGRLGHGRDTHGGSRSDAPPSPSSHDSRGPMLASKGLLRRDGMGPNTGVSTFVQSNRIDNDLGSAFQWASCQRAGVPPPLPPNYGCTVTSSIPRKRDRYARDLPAAFPHSGTTRPRSRGQA